MSRIVGRVVVGVSGSPESLHALRHAVELARQYEALLIAVNAQQTGDRPGPRWQQAAALILRDSFEEGLGGLPRDLECALLAAPGDPGPALLNVADRPNDILVIGAAQPGGSRFGRGPAAAPAQDPDATENQQPARRQLLPALWRRHLRPVIAPAPVGVAAYCVGRAVCSVLSVPPPPLAAPARTATRAPR